MRTKPRYPIVRHSVNNIPIKISDRTRRRLGTQTPRRKTLWIYNWPIMIGHLSKTTQLNSAQLCLSLAGEATRYSITQLAAIYIQMQWGGQKKKSSKASSNIIVIIVTSDCMYPLLYSRGRDRGLPVTRYPHISCTGMRDIYPTNRRNLMRTVFNKNKLSPLPHRAES